VVCRLGRPSSGRGLNRAVETLSQTHSLVRFVSSRLAETDAPKLRPAVASRFRFSDLRSTTRLAPGQYAVLSVLWGFGGQVDQELIAYAGFAIPKGSAIGDDEAESLMHAAAECGVPWFDADAALDLSGIANQCEALQERLAWRFSQEEAARKTKQYDRADFQLRTLERRCKKSVAAWKRSSRASAAEVKELMPPPDMRPVLSR
jgi:hypothetical protein